MSNKRVFIYPRKAGDPGLGRLDDFRQPTLARSAIEKIGLPASIGIALHEPFLPYQHRGNDLPC